MPTDNPYSPVGLTTPSPGEASYALPPRLQPYFKGRVTVYYNNTQSYNDTGTLSYMDSLWVELTKDNGERLLIPIIAIRLVKLVEPSRLEGDAGILLRPAESQVPAEQRQSNRE